MQAIKVETTVEKEGELHLTNLPLHPTQQVEVIVLIREDQRAGVPAVSAQIDEDEWRKLVEMIRASEPRFSTLDEAMSFSRGRL